MFEQDMINQETVPLLVHSTRPLHLRSLIPWIALVRPSLCFPYCTRLCIRFVHRSGFERCKHVAQIVSPFSEISPRSNVDLWGLDYWLDWAHSLFEYVHDTGLGFLKTHFRLV
jgi:hypothetical protein